MHTHIIQLAYSHLGVRPRGNKAVLQQLELLLRRHVLQQRAVLAQQVARRAHEGIMRSPPLQSLQRLQMPIFDQVEYQVYL